MWEGLTSFSPQHENFHSDLWEWCPSSGPQRASQLLATPCEPQTHWLSLKVLPRSWQYLFRILDPYDKLWYNRGFNTSVVNNFKLKKLWVYNPSLVVLVALVLWLVVFLLSYSLNYSNYPHCVSNVSDSYRSVIAKYFFKKRELTR